MITLLVIQGESLLQIVLDDPLLAIGRDDGELQRKLELIWPKYTKRFVLRRTDPCSFQMLHALHTLERAIEEFKLRAGNFEIIFWEGRFNENCFGIILLKTAYISEFIRHREIWFSIRGLFTFIGTFFSLQTSLQTGYFCQHFWGFLWSLLASVQSSKEGADKISCLRSTLMLPTAHVHYG